MIRLSVTALAAVILLCAVDYARPTWGAPPTVETQQAKVLRITATDFQFEPAQITVQPGSQFTVTVTNQGNTIHNIVFRLPDGNVTFPKPLPPGSSASLQLTAPSQPGKHMFYCPVGKHHQMGMHGQLIVLDARQ
jgi:plastocyanin